MYKLYVVYLYETIILGYLDRLEVAEQRYEDTKFQYARKGYTEDTSETKGDEEWVYNATRIPFYGSTGDPTTGEITYTPTGMTDTIELHLELRPKNAIDDMVIPFPENPIKEHFGKK